MGISLNIMDFIAELLHDYPNRNYVLLAISERYAGNREYIKNYRTPIIQDCVRERLKEYEYQIARGTISIRVVSKKIAEELQNNGYCINAGNVRNIINASLRQT